MTSARVDRQSCIAAVIAGAAAAGTRYNKRFNAASFSSLNTMPSKDTTFHDLSFKDNKGNEVAFDKYKGHVVLVVNVAR